MDDGLEGWQRTLDAYDALMLGWVNYLPADDDDSFAGGQVLVVAPAKDIDDFDELSRSLVEDHGYEFVDTERVEWLTSFAHIPIQVFPVAAEAAETGELAFGAFHQYDHEMTPEEQADEDQEWDLVRSSGQLVEVVTVYSELTGVLLDFSDELVLVQHVLKSCAMLDGYGLYPRDEVLRFEPVPPTFVLRALELRGDAPTPIDSPLESMQSFVAWAKTESPLIGIVESRVGGYYVGAITTVGAEVLKVRGVRQDGTWSEDEWEHEYAQIMRIDFQDNYLTALSSIVDPAGWPA